VSAPDGSHVDSLGTRLGLFAQAQLLEAKAHLGSQGDARHKGVHEARKCVRRVRATLALGKAALGASSIRLDDEIGQLGRGLSSLRDAQALIEALSRLDAKEMQSPALLAQAVKLAVENRDAFLAKALTRDADLSARQQRLRRAADRLLKMPWQALTLDDVQRALLRSERRMKKAARRARKHPNDDEVWHQFRRRIRRLRQQNNVLAEIEPQLANCADACKEHAVALGESQDDALLLARCGRRSPFPAHLRSQLRAVATRRLEQARQKL